MKLSNEFTVAAPLEQTWTTLLDIERVGGCLPGATIEPADGNGVHRGRMRMKLGPVNVNYQGSARFIEVDEDAHVTVMEVQGREAKGSGTAAARIVNRLEPVDADRTRVVVETDLQVTGRQAQFGRGIMEDVAGNLLGQFADRLEHVIAEGGGQPAGSATGASDGAGGRAEARSDERAADDDVLDVGNVIGASLGRSAPLVAAAGAAILLAAVGVTVLRQRRRRLSLRLELSL